MQNPNTKRMTAPVSLDECGLAQAADIIGDRWKLLILRELLYGVSRFDDIQKDIGIPRSVFSKRLNELLDQGILKREEYREPGQRKRFEYRLTVKGYGLVVPLVAMQQWAETHETGQRTLTYKHRKSKAPLKVGFVIEGQDVALQDVGITVPGSDEDPNAQ